MSLLAMPLLVINLGAEMIYILDQRLKAQAIPGDKSHRVLNDVVRTMFDGGYVAALLQPQPLYTVSSTRKIFDRLAHSSIMRLSESSMDKLFDLMMMGYKYQLLCSTRLEDILGVTRLHLATIKQILTGITELLPLVSHVEQELDKRYGSLTTGQLHLLRQTLLRFFQDKRVKVSLFLQEGIQSSMGRLILPAPLSPLLGTVRYYGTDGQLQSTEKLPLTNITSIAATEFFVHPCPLGTNLYNKERAKVVPPPRRGDLVVGPLKPVEDEKVAPYKDTYTDKGSKGARQELNLLTALLAVKPPQASDNFKLSLFEDEGSGGLGNSGGQGAGSGVQTLKFGTGGKNDAYKRDGAAGLAGVIQGLDLIGGEGADEEDLLALMDK